MLDKARKYDLEELQRNYEKASPSEKAKIDRVGKQIANQSKTVSAYREALIREIRAGRVDNVRDINESLMKMK